MPRVKVELPEGTTLSIEEETNPDVSQRKFASEEIQRFVNDKDYHLRYRKQIEFGINMGFAIFYRGSEAAKMAQDYMVASMKRRLKDHPELCKRLIPDWSVGCRYVPTCSLSYPHAYILNLVDC